ncbi:MAG TPA: hypothetical protein VLE97_08985 [Gaiellaceae bacterium]|nr:hypothetical protein [Gaiellaceae bacterium]
MTTPTDKPQDAAPQPPAPHQGATGTTQTEPNCFLFTTCVGCGLGIELPLPMDQRTFSIMLAQVGWFVAVMTEPSPDPTAKVVISPLCTACAQQRFAPEMFRVAEQRRQQLLQAAQQAAQGGAAAAPQASAQQPGTPHGDPR